MWSKDWDSPPSPPPYTSPDCSFPIEISWHFCWDSINHICLCVFLHSLFCCIDFYLIVCQYYLVLITVALWYALKSSSVSSPTLFFFFCKVALAILGSLFFLIHFRISLSISTIKSLRILVEIALNLCIRRIDTLAILSLCIVEYGTSLHLIRSSISAIFYSFRYTGLKIILLYLSLSISNFGCYCKWYEF